MSSILNGGAWIGELMQSTIALLLRILKLATSEAAMEAVWIRKFISGLGIVPTINEPLNMYCDNSAAIHYANEPGVQKGARHYHRRYHYVSGVVLKLGEIRILKVHTDNNLADHFTKALSNRKLTQHVGSQGFRDLALDLGGFACGDYTHAYLEDGVNGYLKRCITSMLVEVQEAVSLSDFCWTSIVSGNVSCGMLDEARMLFDKSPVKDIVLWTAMINGYIQFNHVDEAMRLFQQMQKFKIKPDKFTVVALLTGCAQLRALEQGNWIHEYMNEHRIVIHAVCGTALFDMYAKCGCIYKSLEVFYGLHDKDTASWTSIICALSVNGKTSVLNACSHGGLVEEGWKYFESMKSMHEIEPKIEHYGCLIDLLARAGLLKEAERKVNRIPKEKDDILVPVYGALLSACRLYGDVGMGEHLADRLMKIQVGDSSIHTILANIYASVGRWEDVKKNSYDDDEVLYLWSGWKNGQVSETMYEIAKFKFSRNVDFTDIHGMMNIGLTSRNVTSWIVVELSNATGNSVVIKGCFGHYQNGLELSEEDVVGKSER
ncbi:pentatricopeptide repeat-containing protein [Tanacetum coccineum]